MRKTTQKTINILLKVLIYSVPAILITVLQNTVFPLLSFDGIVPDVILPAVYTVAFYMGEKNGAIFGLCTGFLSSALSSTGFSVLPIFYMICGLVGGVLGNNASKTAFFRAFLVTILPHYVAREIITVLTLLVSNGFSLDCQTVFMRIVPIETAYSLIMMLPIFLLMKLFEIPARELRV